MSDQYFNKRFVSAVVAGALGFLSVPALATYPQYDSTFNGGGTRIVDLGGDDFVNSLIEQSDGKLVGAGTTASGGRTQFALFRLNANGSLNTNFGTSGKVITGIGTIEDKASSLIQQSDGKLVAAGYTDTGGTSQFAMVRYNSDGSLDASFGVNGVVTTPIYNAAIGVAVIQQADDKLVMAGYCYGASGSDFAIARYLPDGTLDTSFGTNGITVTSFDNTDRAASLLQQLDGKLVVVGYTVVSSSAHVAVARYDADGALDTSFGNQGEAIISVGTGYDYGQAVAQQADGKLVIAGKNVYLAPESNFMAVRLNMDGSLDTTFDGDGKVTTDMGGDLETAYSVAVQANGKIVVAGDTTLGPLNMAIARYNGNGSLDTTFDDDGKVTYSSGSGKYSGIRSAISDADGNLVVAGHTNKNGTYDFIFSRYITDPDTDGDGVDDSGDNCIDISNADQLDTDGDDVGDVCDAFPNDVNETVDGDGDGVGDNGDNCVALANASQINTDGDVVGDDCDAFPNDPEETTDTDGDAVGDNADVFPDDPAEWLDTDGDTVGDNADALTNGVADMDVTFDDDGWAYANLKRYRVDNRTYSALQQSDGKLVIAGYIDSPVFAMGLARFNTDGSLDTSFGDGGQVVSIAGVANGIIQQADGKLVVVGETYIEGESNLVLVRFHIDGTLDTSFDQDGYLLMPSATAYSVVQQSDGKLVVSGTYVGGSQVDLLLVRYNSDGSLDSSFDGDGIVTTNAAVNSEEEAYSLIQQADGKFVVVGVQYIFNDWTRNTILARYHNDGSLDAGFDGDGVMVTSLASGDDAAADVIQQTDGKLVVVGYRRETSTYEMALQRYNDDGSLDTDFDGDGKVSSAIAGISGTGEAGRNFSVVQQADGKLVAETVTTRNGDSGFVMVRYNSDGSVDTGFDSDGIVESVVTGTGSSPASSVVVSQVDGKLVVANSVAANFKGDFQFTRYNTDGSLDTGFGAGGRASVNAGIKSVDESHSIIQQLDGKLVVAGSSHNSAEYDFAVTRFNSNGSLDTAFDGDGKVITTFGTRDDVAYAVTQQSDGKLVLAGYNQYSVGGSNFALARYNSDGSLDSGFSGDGKLTTTVGNGVDGRAYALLQQTDGKLLAAGHITNVNKDFGLVRYLSDGTLDTSFDGDGKASIAIGSSNDEVYSVIQQPDGKLVAAGYSIIGSDRDFSIARFNSNGSLDTSFSGDGKLTTGLAAGSNDTASAIIQQSDGKLVVAGYTVPAVGQYSFAMVRYNMDGSLDTSFDGDGIVITDMGVGSDQANSIVQQTDGKLVVGGISGSNFAIARYNTDGSLDVGFNGDGKRILPCGDYACVENSIIQQTDGKLVFTGGNFVVARLISGQPDTDGDGRLDILDNCPSASNFQQTDTDQDGAGDVCDSTPNGDTDGDGIDNSSDNCLVIPNALQTNTDGDAVGDACDAFPDDATETTDTDGDGVGDNGDVFPNNPAESVDSDGDGVGDNGDAFPNDATETTDTDGDGVGDNGDVFPNDPDEIFDTDVDGVGDNGDTCIALINPDQLDSDDNGFGDACEVNTLGLIKTDRTGTAVALADMDGDSFADVIIGSPLADVTVGSTILKDAGTITIISGDDGVVLNTFKGTVAKQQLGAAIAVVPDQNTDNVPDLIIGNPLADPLVLGVVQKDAGNVSLYSGADGTLLQSIADGSVKGDKFGAAVAVGDVNNDGYMDLVVGAPLADTTDAITLKAIKDVGRVYVFNGVTSGNVLYSRRGTQAKEFFGSAVTINTVDDQLLVGSPGFDVLLPVKLTDTGRVQIFDATDLTGNSAALFTISGTIKGDKFGSALGSFNQDLDTDGETDWAVGVPGADILDIATNKILKDVGRVKIYSEDTNTGTEVEGAAKGDFFGSAVVADGDINNDGINDLVIGAPKFDVPTVINSKATTLKDAGRVEVISGAELF